MNPSDPLTSPDSGDAEDIFKSTFKVYGSFVKEVKNKCKTSCQRMKPEDTFFKSFYTCRDLWVGQRSQRQLRRLKQVSRIRNSVYGFDLYFGQCKEKTTAGILPLMLLNIF